MSFSDRERAEGFPFSGSSGVSITSRERVEGFHHSGSTAGAVPSLVESAASERVEGFQRTRSTAMTVTNTAGQLTEDSHPPESATDHSSAR